MSLTRKEGAENPPEIWLKMLLAPLSFFFFLLDCERFKMTKGFTISVLLETVLVEKVPETVVADGAATSLDDATL